MHMYIHIYMGCAFREAGLGGMEYTPVHMYTRYICTCIRIYMGAMEYTYIYLYTYTHINIYTLTHMYT